MRLIVVTCHHYVIVYCDPQDAIGCGMLTFGHHGRHNCFDSSTYVTCRDNTISKLAFLLSVDKILIKEMHNNSILYNVVSADFTKY